MEYLSFFMVQKILMIAISGINDAPLLSMPTLYSYLRQFSEVREKYAITILDRKATDPIIDFCTGYDWILLSCYVWNKEKVNEIVSIAQKTHSRHIVVGGPEVGNDCFEEGVYYVAGAGEKKLYKILMGKDPPPDAKYISPYQDGTVDYDYLRDCIAARANIETQRGCNNKCYYCKYHMNMPEITYRDPLDVCRDLDLIHGTHCNMVRFVDANFFSSESHAMTILLYLCKMRFKVAFEVLPEYITPRLCEIIKMCVDSGNEITIGVGLQSIDREVVEAIGRKSDFSCFERNIRMLEKAGACVRIDLMLGLPYCTKHNYFDSLVYVIDLMNETSYTNLSITYVIPGTPLYNMNKVDKTLEVDSEGKVIKTKWMTKEDIEYCNKLNIVIHRIFSPSPTERDLRKEFIWKAFTKNTAPINLISMLADKMEFKYGNLDPMEYFHRQVFIDYSYDRMMGLLQ